MATGGFESLAGLRKQIVENCYFFNPSSGEISLIITHEPIGTYKAIVLCETRRQRDVLLSSDSFETVTKALEHLFTKSADAVQHYITANEFRRLPSAVDDDEDDEDDDGSSVSSYVEEPEKDRLADSSLSLDSGLESPSEGLSEDGDGTVSYSRVRTGGRPRSYGARTVRLDSHSRSRSRDRTPAYHKAPAPPARFPLQRSRAVDPPRPYIGHPGVSDYGNMRIPTLPLQMPPMPGPGFMGHCADVRPPPDSHPTDAPMNGASMAHHQQRLNAIQQQREEVKRVLQEGQRRGFLDLDGKPSLPPGAMLPLWSGHPSPPGPWPPLYTANDRPYMAPPVTTRSQTVPPQQPIPSQNPPTKNTHPPGKASPPLMMHSTSSNSSLASSITPSIVPASASSTPTVTVNLKTPPEYSSALAPASIDCRLVIKTPFPLTLEGVSRCQEHRILARTPPTRKDMSLVALRYVQQKLPYLENVAEGPLRATVTRAVFNAGQSREESYDLGAYPESNFSKLCEIMERSGEEEDRGGLPQVNGWPLFEVVVSVME